MGSILDAPGWRVVLAGRSLIRQPAAMPAYYDTAERRHKPSPFQGEGAPARTLGRMRVRTLGASPGGPLIRQPSAATFPPVGGRHGNMDTAPRNRRFPHHRPRTLAAPRRRQPWEPPTPQYLHTSGSTNGGEASPDPHEPITPPPRFPRKQRGVHRGEPPYARSLVTFSRVRESNAPRRGAPGKNPRRGVPCPHPRGNGGNPGRGAHPPTPPAPPDAPAQWWKSRACR